MALHPDELGAAPSPSPPMNHHAALFRIRERYAATPDARARLLNPYTLSPHEAVRLVAGLAGGSLAYTDDAEPSVQGEDLVAALSLFPLLRAETDDLELGLLTMARGEGLTWAQIADRLGLAGEREAEQRHVLLTSRGTAPAGGGG
ncbi:hypothetical protein O2W18_19850 [Modestobacter sp. VKM Ac-2983]|uniref:hypothetical protein n=1 Tax=Modestobacter sp. VKM Ac-2983 TaxID=3004137 RepID=UPI0022ABC541|nr:hypothetical protein [Modestobacter sp. VKM Ac-2983]MCZ2807366.1 hypothetical protein [Modestobacter sp. VKM Ac-2983]